MIRLSKIKRNLQRATLRLTNRPESEIIKEFEHNEKILSTEDHLKLAADWLLLAQEKSGDGGYSRSYLPLLQFWEKSYVETTGYIIPTLLEYTRLTNDETYKKSALNAGEFLLSAQRPSGAFCEIETGQELAFDTGQCLLGLNALAYREGIEKYKSAAIRAGQWLVDAMDADATWTKFGYLGRAHSYYSRVAAALIELGALSGRKEFTAAGIRNLNWVIAQQCANGFFRNSSFHKGVDSVLHTIVYVLEGLILAYKYIPTAEIRKALEKGCEALKKINIERDLILLSQYDESGIATNKEKCITGLAQWSGVCFEMYHMTKNKDYFDLGARTFYYLKSKQYQEGENLKGTFPGSLPIQGYYSPMSCVNWANKFFIDAGILYSQYGKSVMDEEELWVSSCFSLLADKMPEELNQAAAVNYFKLKDLIVQKDLQSKGLIVDLGCGRGRFVRQIRADFPRANVLGIDPYFGGKVENVLTGSCYKLDLDPCSVDLIFAFEVLQHVNNLDFALKVIKKSLRQGGVLLIEDRDPRSILGLLKPYYERRGKWMYPSDSPFFEKWMSYQQWKELLGRNGLQISSYESYWHSSWRRPFFHRFCVLVATAD